MPHVQQMEVNVQNVILDISWHQQRHVQHVQVNHNVQHVQQMEANVQNVTVIIIWRHPHHVKHAPRLPIVRHVLRHQMLVRSVQQDSIQKEPVVKRVQR